MVPEITARLSRTVCAMRSTRPAPTAAFAALLKDVDLGRKLSESGSPLTVLIVLSSALLAPMR
jgi:hypothetical protein